MNITHSDFWFFRKIMSTRENLLIVLMLTFLMLIFVLSELSHVFVMLAGSIGLSCAQIVRRLQNNAQFSLLPNYTIKQSLIINIAFLLLAVAVFTPFVLRNPEANSLKLFAFVYSATLVIGFFPLIYFTFVATLMGIVLCLALDFEHMPNVIGTTIEKIFMHPLGSALVIVFSLVFYLLGILGRFSFLTSTIQPTIKNHKFLKVSSDKVPGFNSDNGDQLHEGLAPKALGMALALFFILHEISIPYFSPEKPILISIFILFYLSVITSIIGPLLQSNIDRLWLAAQDQEKQKFLLKNILKKQGIANIVLAIAYVHNASIQSDYAPAILWFFILQLFLHSVSNISLRKRIAIPLSFSGTAALVFASSSPLISICIAAVIWLCSVIYYVKGKGFHNGRLSGATLGIPH